MFYYRQLLLIVFTKINRIVFLAIFVMLIVFFAHTISYSYALAGNQPQQQQNSRTFNVKITEVTVYWNQQYMQLIIVILIITTTTIMRRLLIFRFGFRIFFTTI